MQGYGLAISACKMGMIWWSQGSLRRHKCNVRRSRFLAKSRICRRKTPFFSKGWRERSWGIVGVVGVPSGKSTCVLLERGLFFLCAFFCFFCFFGVLELVMADSETLFFSRQSPPEQGARLVETICGCKWSMTVFRLLSNDICRPGAMVRSVEGLTTKVLNQCLRKNVEFGTIERTAYPEIPPRVEYHLTPLGHRLIDILGQIEMLQEEFVLFEHE